MEVSDLTLLEHLDESSLLAALERNYKLGKIYTYIGDVLVSINPYGRVKIYDKTHHDKYRGIERRSDLPPHIFWVANKTYQRLVQDRTDQAILMSGESGAGKTESTKLVVEHLAYVCSQGRGDTAGSLHEKIIKVNPLLEAFGNAGTVIHDNSSRFGKYIELFFYQDGRLAGSEIQDYMLEKSRVVQRREGDRNYHVFYYLLADPSPQTRHKYGLGEADQYRILRDPLDQATFRDSADRQRCARGLDEILRIMADIGLRKEEVSFVLSVVAAVLHLTSIQFEEKDDMTGGARVVDEGPLRHVCHVLHVDERELRSALLVELLADNAAHSAGNLTRARSVVQAGEARDALAKVLYQALFSWLVRRVNVHLMPDGKPDSRSSNTIGILDMSGFEEFPQNGFDQLLINVANEQLQFFFNEHIFSMDQKVLKLGGIDWTKITYENNGPILDMFMGNGKSQGLLDTIDEASRTPRFSDSMLVQRLHEAYTQVPHYKRTHRGDQPLFNIVHFAGEVTYDAEGFLEKNRDPVSLDLCRVISRSSQPLVAQLFGDELFREINSKQHKKSVTRFFRNSLFQLVNKLGQAQPIFVRCIKPNQAREPRVFDRPSVIHQLRHNGLLEMAKIRKIGFPVRLKKQAFVQRYGLVLGYGYQFREDTLTCRDILTATKLKDAEIGIDEVFLKEWQRDELDRTIKDIHHKVKVIQKWYRGHVARKKYRNLRAKAKLNNALSKASTNSTNPYETLPHDKMRTTGSGRPTDTVRTSSSSLGNLDSVSIPAKRMSSFADDESSETTEMLSSPPDHRKCQEEEDERILSSAKWDLFRVIPRERISPEESFSGVVKCLKVFMYLFTMLLFTACLVLNSGTLVLMTTTLSHLQENLQASNASADIATFTKNRRHRNTMITSMQICMCMPYALGFITYFFKGLFGSQPWPSFVNLLLLLFLETIQTLASCAMVFLCLPELDMLRAVCVMNLTCLIPGLFKMAFARAPKISSGTPDPLNPVESSHRNKTKFIVPYYLLNTFAVFAQLTGLGLIGWGNFEFFPAPASNQTDQFIFHRDVVNFDDSTQHPWGRWLFLLSLALMSVTWWENFIDFDFTIRERTIIPFRQWKVRIYKLRQKTTMFTSLWNIGLILAFPFICAWYFEHFEFDLWVDNANRKFTDEKVAEFAPQITNGLSALFGYTTGALGCRLLMQKASFNIPLILATPLTVLFILLQCSLDTFIPSFGLYSWHCPEGLKTDFLLPESIWQIAVCGIWWLSIIIIAGYLWRPKQNAMDKNEKLFVRPLYEPVFFAQSMMLNRRRRDNEVQHNDFTDQYYILDDDKSSVTTGTYVRKQDLDYQSKNMIPMIYACATMWHETKNEMTQLMKSIFRMDKDYAIRANLKVVDETFEDPDFYDFESHIFFDDAMELSDNGFFVPNQFVRQLFDVVDEAASSVHRIAVTLKDPQRIPTPYGGRLVWDLPGGTKLNVHLKDKNKIRHKKRWSQCMYMYYLLGYELPGLVDASPPNNKKKESQFLPGSIFRYMPDEVHKRAQSTFILALDGDVDFKPEAVRLLVDQMKTNPKVGSACGRIHPIGSGPVVWFQQFEYAIGHWLQKAAEHVYGCVLCSPGCFSLFRASAIMDDNVMRRYCDKAETPKDVVQFDQGEDRWLCTLLLQKGYRVTYCAAADALTYAPETFHEFYNQRRRWTPSTMANIIDLLSSYKETIKVNDNMSYPYMFYQFILFFASILAPGTTLMMIAGSYNAVLGTDLLQSNILALEPIIFFILICFTTKPDTHILVASAFSAVYSIIMTVVMVGTIINAVTFSITSPNVVFLLTLCGFFFLSGILHPQEIMCLLGGILYLLTFPSAYVLLPLYSLCNLNVVSWGTREIPRKKTKEELEQERIEEEERKKEKMKKKGILSWLGLDSFLQDIKEFYNSVIPGKRMGEPMGEINHVDPEQGADGNLMETGQRNELREMLNRKKGESAPKPVPPKTAAKDTAPKVVVEDPNNPDWLTSTATGDGQRVDLDEKESAFWRELIRIYLHPLVKNKKKERELEIGLKTLRTNIVFLFLMTNFLWAIILFQFQLLKEPLEDQLFIPIPRADDPTGEPLKFEPLGLAFLAVFGIVLLLQFIGTVIHTWNTFCHIIARKELSSSENSIKGKLELGEKLVTFEDELPPDYDTDEEPLPDYDESTNQKNENNNPFDDSNFTNGASINGNQSMPSHRDPMSSLPSRHENNQYRQRYPESQDNYGRDYLQHRQPNHGRYQDSNNSGRRYRRYQPRLGQVHMASGNSLHRNFQRKYNHYLKNMKDAPDRSAYRPGDIEGGARPKRSFDALYRQMSHNGPPNGGYPGQHHHHHHHRHQPHQQQYGNHQYDRRYAPARYP